MTLVCGYRGEATSYQPRATTRVYNTWYNINIQISIFDYLLYEQCDSGDGILKLLNGLLWNLIQSVIKSSDFAASYGFPLLPCVIKILGF